ncbi:predicted protein [Nematostella vectensis]|uniref:Uncharacterized protein n=1 Tax=Nematostella vectensis TaxID=45351 RepID=A7SUN4_NEMVE|nr:predicted protein [Nematostella vectensis]|eukprot:XP_001624674.1 predicted protein [Nematostella vectensis]
MAFKSKALKQAWNLMYVPFCYVALALAKACVCNTVQYNGKFGCPKCYQPGCTVKTGSKGGGHAHAFLFQRGDPTGPMRTKEQNLLEAREALRSGKPVQGTKGPSWLAGLQHFDIKRGTSIDYMHCVLQGITKSLLNLWFSSSYKSEAFNICDRVKMADARLSQIRPPNDITRYPRKIENERQYWKASELGSFLQHPPELGSFLQHPPGFLPEENYKHFVLFSEAIFILLCENIAHAQINHAEKLLQHFCLMFSSLYPASKETINIHSLVNICDDVRDLGPLWTHSCFPFENYNGNLSFFTEPRA